MDPITSVMRAMTDSVSSVKPAAAALAVFRQAKDRGDEEGANRAAGFADDAMPGAVQSGQVSQEALVKAQAEIQAQESLRWQRLREEARARDRARMRRALEKAREEAQEAYEEDSGAQGSGEEASLQTDAGGTGRKAAESSDGPVRSGDPAEKGVVYTQMGEIRPKAADKKLTVTA